MEAPQEKRFGKGGDALFGQYFAVSGARAGVVVATGIHQHSDMYVRFAQRLQSEGFAVLAYDHRGFGRSASYDGCARSQVPEFLNLDVPSCAGDLADAVDLLKTLADRSKVFVWGHSLGGTAAVILATSGRNNAAGFVLSNATVHGNFGSPEKAAEWEAGDPETVINDSSAMETTSVCKNKLFYETWTTPPQVDLVDQADGRLMPFKAAYCAKVFHAITAMRQRFGSFVAPALLLRGGEDIATNEGGGLAELAAGASKDAPLTLINYPGCGHDVIFEECPEGLSMEPGNRVVDDLVVWLKAQT